LAVLGALACASAQAVSVDLVLGSNLGPLIPQRVLQYLGRAHAKVTVRSDGTCGGEANICLALGASAATASVINASALGAAGEEGFVVYDGPLPAAGSVTRRFLAMDGNPGQLPRVDDPSCDSGAAFGAFYVLERIGFAFVHAFQPVVPSSLDFAASFAPPAGTITTRSPHWAVRSWHYHTEHPLEMTDFLQGFDATCVPPGADASNCTFHEPWELMFDRWLEQLDWLSAAGQNRLEWIPLHDAAWGPAADSEQRMARFRNMTATLHAYGLRAVIDVPVAERQQNAWYMTSASGAPEQNNAEIAAQLDRWAKAGFDLVSTESGFSEFTHPACDVMLALLNFTAEYAHDAHGMQVFVKAHCSSGQTCPDYPDPRTGEPINFNFLPALGAPLLNVMPHTAQIYSEGDPTSNSYGNDNLTYMFDFATWLAKRATASGDGREVVWHPESAYWVNYDIDVGLALGPLYGERRMNDLRVLARAQAASPGGMTALRGQNVFASGSPWSYWLGNTVTARGAWDPKLSAPSSAAAFAEALDDVAAALFFGSTQGEAPAARLKAVLGDVVREQRQVLVLGNATGVPAPPPGPAGTTQRNGMAYLAGQDTWSTLEAAVTGHSTQPDRLPLAALAANSTPGLYETSVRPLLAALARTTAAHLASLAELRADVRAEALVLFDDLAAAFNVTALRAAQVQAVYEAVAPGASNTTRAAALARARAAILAAADVVARNEPRYGVPPERVAGWRGNPTSYTFGFLWTVRSQFYMWRDYGMATALANAAQGAPADIRRLSPCYLNINDPANVAIGDDTLEAIAVWAHNEAEKTGVDWIQAIGDCLAAPSAQWEFPGDL